MTRRADIYTTLDHDAVEGRLATAAGRAVIVALFVALCYWVQHLPGAPKFAWAFIFFLFPFPFIGWLVFAQAVKMVGDVILGLGAYHNRRRHAAAMRRDSVADVDVPPVMLPHQIRALDAQRKLEDFVRAMPQERYSERERRLKEEKAAAVKKAEPKQERHSTTAVVKKDQEDEDCECYYPPDTKDEAHRMFVRKMAESWDLDSAMGDERDTINRLRHEGKL